MLSQASRQEVIRKINVKAGFVVAEATLTPATRQAITNLATIQRHLYIVLEILRGEQSRIERSTILTAASKIGMGSERAERAALTDEVSKLQAEIDNKIGELANQIMAEQNAAQSGQPPPAYKGSLELVQLKCPNCGASLPIPTSQFIQCQFCKNTFTIRDVSAQIRSMIQSI